MLKSFALRKDPSIRGKTCLARGTRRGVRSLGEMTTPPPRSKQADEAGASERAGAGEPAGAESAPGDREASAEDLRRQVALLAEQVRRLGEPAGGGGDESGSGAADAGGEPAMELPIAPQPRPRHDAAVEAPAADPRPAVANPLPAVAEPLPARADPSPAEAARLTSPPQAAGKTPLAGETPPGSVGETLAERHARLIASVVALAELAAVEIRTSAEVEAATIRARASEQLSESTINHLVTLLERQRRMIEALAAQTDRLEGAGAILRAQIRALDAERQHIYEILATTRRTP